MVSVGAARAVGLALLASTMVLATSAAGQIGVGVGTGNVPPDLIHAAPDINGDGHAAVKVALNDRTDISQTIIFRTTGAPAHEAFGFWLLDGAERVVAATFVIVVDGQVHSYIEGDLSPQDITIQRQDFPVHQQTTVGVIYRGVPAGTWTLLATGASPANTYDHIHHVHGHSANASYVARDVGGSAFLLMDRDFEGDLHVQHNDVPADLFGASVATRTELAVNVDASTSSFGGLWGFFIMNGQEAQGSVIAPSGAETTGATCYLIADGSSGTWTYHVDRFVGSTTYVPAVILYTDPCITLGRVGPLVPTTGTATSGIIPEGMFAFGADRVSLP